MEAPNLDVYIVDSFDGLEQLEQYVNNGKFPVLSLDLETDSSTEKKAKIYGVGLAFNEDEAFYIPVRDKHGELLWPTEGLKDIYEWVAELCRAHKLIGHNLMYDTLVFEYNSGIEISHLIHADTMLMKHTINEERPFGLKENAVAYLGTWADKAQNALYDNIEANGGSTTKENLEMFKADTDVLGEYCGWDTLLALRLYNLFEKRLQEEGLADLFYKEEIMPLYREVTISMKRNGFPIDVEYFKELKKEIEADILGIEKDIYSEIEQYVWEFEDRLLAEDYPVKRTGNFPKAVAALCEAKLPEKDGKVTLSKTAITKAVKQGETNPFFAWMLDECAACPVKVRDVQKKLFFDANPDKRYIFNLKSGDHLGWLLFDKLKETPLSKTETGKPQCDDDYLESIRDKYSFVAKLSDYKKLIKLSSTYIDGMLERHIDGVIYTTMFQVGTTSGRYSSINPNLQNIPRVKDEEANLSPLVLRYVNAIKRGFVAPKGYKIVNADYSSLEPVCFAHVSNEERLRDVFRRGYDLYSAIAIDVFGLSDCSADKKAPNYLKKKYPEKRQLAKIFCLAVVYGAEAGRISQLMGIDFKEAESIINAYLDAYPELRKYMQRCDFTASKHGFVKTEFGRIRHLQHAKDLYARWGTRLLDRRFAKANGLDDIRYKYKNALNNSKNFPIQGLAAHIVNRAAIRITREFKAQGIVGWLAVQVHDELTFIVREDQAELAKKIVKEGMENTTKISVPLVAEPLIADNWSDAK